MEDNDMLHLLRSEPEAGVAQFLEQYASLVYSIVAGRTRGVASKEDITGMMVLPVLTPLTVLSGMIYNS